MEKQIVDKKLAGTVREVHQEYHRPAWSILLTKRYPSPVQIYGQSGQKGAKKFITKAEMEKMFADQVKSIDNQTRVLQKTIQDTPVYIPVQGGYIKKTPALNEKITFE